MLVSIGILLPFLQLGLTAICPLINHAICNAKHHNHACVCAITKQEAPPPEKSCNLLLGIKSDDFPGVSAEFELNSHVEHLKKFPERKFRSLISKKLHVDPDRIVVLRERCLYDDKKFVLQFGVLKRDVQIEPEKVTKKKVTASDEEVKDDDNDDDDEDDSNENADKAESKTQQDNDSDDDDDDDDDDNDDNVQVKKHKSSKQQVAEQENNDANEKTKSTRNNKNDDDYSYQESTENKGEEGRNKSGVQSKNKVEKQSDDDKSDDDDKDETTKDDNDNDNNKTDDGGDDEDDDDDDDDNSNKEDNSDENDDDDETDEPLFDERGVRKPYKLKDFEDTAKIAKDLRVDETLEYFEDMKVEFREVKELYNIEAFQSNNVLIFQAAFAGALVALICILGVWRAIVTREKHQYESVEGKV